MKKTLWAPSLDRGLELEKLGVVLPYLERLPGKTQPRERALYVLQLEGYVESLAIEHETFTDYLIALRLGTDLSSVIVDGFGFTPPWPEHEISWDFDPKDELPKNILDRYDGLTESRLPGVMKERRHLYGGHPLDGLLYGRAWTAIPASFPREASAKGEIVLVTTSGVRLRSEILLWVYTPKRRTDATRERKTFVDLHTASVTRL